MISYLKKLLHSFTKAGVKKQRTQLVQQTCNHEKWNIDNQIRVIECKSCGKRAWVDDYVDLFKN